jgi:DNA replication protein DnaC
MDNHPIDDYPPEVLNEWICRVRPLYRGTDVSLLPQHLLKRIMAWQYGPTGIALFGPPGTCKTRILYQLLRRLHFEERRRWLSFGSSNSFGDETAASYLQGTGPEWIKKVSAVAVVLFEDLAKEKLTDRAGDALYQAIEGRCARLNPTLIACNCGIDELVERLGPDRGPAVKRRILEHSLTIVLKGSGSKVTIVHEEKPSPLVLRSAELARMESEQLSKISPRRESM